ncbi:MAG: hypothetical protein CR968_00495 [Flavobacteriia bacterium]|nr:MAG: hypothetical protein CR968_00495 [Flavobacteriia bacterium]
MNFLLIILGIIALIVVFYFIAKFIVNYIPRQFHWVISLLLLFVSIFLGYKIYDSIIGDIKFDKEKKVRYQKAIDRLKLIREAEVMYRSAKEDYTKSFDTLIMFIEHDSMPILRTFERTKTVVERGVSVVKEYKEVKVIGYTRVLDAFKGKDYKNMKYIPGTKKTFELNTDYVEKGVNKYKAPVFEVKVNKKDILEGMDKELIKREISIVGVDEINGEYITVGTLNDVKDTGNWPPSYDKLSTEDEK